MSNQNHVEQAMPIDIENVVRKKEKEEQDSDTSEDSPSDTFVGSSQGKAVASERARNRRKRCIMVASFFPFLAASIALGGFVYTRRKSTAEENSNGNGAVDAANADDNSAASVSNSPPTSTPDPSPSNDDDTIEDILHIVEGILHTDTVSTSEPSSPSSQVEEEAVEEKQDANEDDGNSLPLSTPSSPTPPISNTAPKLPAPLLNEEEDGEEEEEDDEDEDLPIHSASSIDEEAEEVVTTTTMPTPKLPAPLLNEEEDGEEEKEEDEDLPIYSASSINANEEVSTTMSTMTHGNLRSTNSPTVGPTRSTNSPTVGPTKDATNSPTVGPTKDATNSPTVGPTKHALPATSFVDVEMSNVLVDKGDDGFPAAVFPLGECQGDCDEDDDCQGSLVCFQRETLESVPGCSGEGSPTTDYCSNRPVDYLWISTLDFKKFPLGACMGDCDGDWDCESGLICQERDDFGEIPGCRGMGLKDSDYCRYPDETVIPEASAGSSNESSLDAISEKEDATIISIDDSGSEEELPGSAETEHGNLRSSPPTPAPISSSPTLAPILPEPAGCVADGEPCPEVLHLSGCCSEFCEKDQLSGEQVCASQAQEEDATIATPNESAPGAPSDTCVETGQTCPGNKKMCCDGFCDENKVTKEKVCGAWIQGDTASLSGNTCVASGEPCPGDKKLCCSGKCAKDKEAEKGIDKENNKQEVCE